jgi:hypothetical protein
MNSWRDPTFHYHKSETHATNSIAFRRRMQERRRQALAAAAETRSKVQPIAKKQAAK